MSREPRTPTGYISISLMIDGRVMAQSVVHDFSKTRRDYKKETSE